MRFREEVAARDGEVVAEIERASSSRGVGRRSSSRQREEEGRGNWRWWWHTGGLRDGSEAKELGGALTRVTRHSRRSV